MNIILYLYDLVNKKFEKLYFHHWEGARPIFSKNKKNAKRYSNEQIANADIEQLKKAKSPIATTLSIRLEEA